MVMLVMMLLWLVDRVDLPLDDDDDDDCYRDASRRGDKKILRTARSLVVRRAEAPWLDVGTAVVVVAVAVVVVVLVVGMVVVVASIGVVGAGVGAGAGAGGWCRFRRAVVAVPWYGPRDTSPSRGHGIPSVVRRVH